VQSRVAPRVGAWIEIKFTGRKALRSTVAPRVGAWIEIHFGRYNNQLVLSLPVWERGLKSLRSSSHRIKRLVAPRVGAWIEIPDKLPCAVMP